VAAGPATSAHADSLLYRCGPNLCRIAPDGSGRTQLTTDGGYAWLSATRDGSRLAVSKGTFAYVVDGSGRQLGGALPRGGTTLVAQIAPDGSRVATLELLGELTPPPPRANPTDPPLLGFVPYLFTMALDGSGREAAARSVVDTAWLGNRLVRSDTNAAAPFARGLCLLAALDHFVCERDIARDGANDLSSPALSPDGRFAVVAQTPEAEERGSGPLVLYDTASARPVRALTSGPADGLPTFSPDGRRIAFTRDGAIYVTSVTGGAARRVATGIQPVWVTACAFQRTLRPVLRSGKLTVAACAPAAGRLTVTLTLRGRRVGRRSVKAVAAGTVNVTFPRPRGARVSALRATIAFSAAAR
jgi:dipeptidyl aminopeptidase/acylaminoacyl peptidase